MERYRLHIDGEWVDAASGRTFQSIDPFRGEPWAEVPDAGAEDVELAVQAARRALAGPWGALTGKERGRLMRELARVLARDADALARIETRDNGKLLREMTVQCRALSDYYEFFAGAADKLGGQVVPTDRPSFLVYTRHEPVGVVGAIVPWNSPLLLMTWKLAAALAAGCTFVCKPTDQTPAYHDLDGIRARTKPRRVNFDCLPADTGAHDRRQSAK